VPRERRAKLIEVLFEAAEGPPGRDRSTAVRALIDLSRHNVEALRAAGELEYRDLVAEIEALKRAQLGETPAGSEPAETGAPEPSAGGD
jgi:hypothetical protein